jgi:hypothetical protein
LNTAWPLGSGADGATGAGAASTLPPAAASSSADSSAGSSSQPSWSSSVYARTRGICRQLSMLPVGQGGTQSMHRLHLAASTT